MGPDDIYTIFQKEGRDTGAAYTMRQEDKARGVPPHWMLYVAVESADETASRAAQLGAKVIVDPMDVAEVGRMAVVQDPTGAVLALWQAKSHKGTGIAGVPGTLCWADLMAPDARRATEFYAALFGWKFEAAQDGSGYLHIQNHTEYIGGVPPAEHRNPNAPPHWLPYFSAVDCDHSAGVAEDLGATLCVKPMTLEGVGRWAVAEDPQGAVFALFQAVPRSEGQHGS